jgi:hypothetical protein
MSKADRTRQFLIAQTAPVCTTLGYAGTALAHLAAVTELTMGAPTWPAGPLRSAPPCPGGWGNLAGAGPPSSLLPCKPAGLTSGR